jgi:pyruvyltransferase
LHKSSIESVKHLNFDIRAVRGPNTRKVLIENGFDCPDIYGDPAILMPLFYNPCLPKKTKYVIIPHHLKYHKYQANYSNAVVLSTITSDWKNFIKSIVEAEMVISSSLHGIILAEAYGVPCVFLNDAEGSLFKYEDYYHSTGRKAFKSAESIDHAIEIGPEVLPNLESLQKQLLSSFPIDLWN